MSVLSEDHGFAQQDDAPATRDTGQLLLVGLVVLALAASVIMMLTGNINLLKVALLAALWAAVFGIFLTYFYRNKLSEQKLEHENQIEQARLAFHAEQAARELELEQRITEKTNDATQETLDKIKDQLDNLRSQLEMLSGVSFEEPAMIRAEAHRIKEIKEISASDGMDYGSVDFDTTTSDHEMAEDYRESDDVSVDSDQFNNARFGTYPTFTGSGSNATDMTDVFSHVPDPEPEFDPDAEWDESKHFSEFPVETATNNSNMEDSAVDGEPIPTDYDLPSYSSWESNRYASENSEDAEVEEPTGSFPANADVNANASAGSSGSDSGRSGGAHSSPDNSGASTSGYGADFSAARLQNIYGRSAASSQATQGSRAAQGAQGSQSSGGHTSHRGSDSFAFGNSSNAANANAGEADSRDITNARSNDANTPNRATYPNFAMPSGSQETPTTRPRIKTIGAATAAAGIPRIPTRPASATPTMGPADIPPPTIPPRPPIRTMIRPLRCMKLPVPQGRRTPPRTGRRQARRWGIPRPPTPPIPLAVSRTPAVGGSGWPPGRPRARAAGGVVSKANPSRSHRTTGARTGDPNKKPKIRGTGGGVGMKAAG